MQIGFASSVFSSKAHRFCGHTNLNRSRSTRLICGLRHIVDHAMPCVYHRLHLSKIAPLSSRRSHSSSLGIQTGPLQSSGDNLRHAPLISSLTMRLKDRFRVGIGSAAPSPCGYKMQTATCKGGDPAAGSPTATLLRLHPSHHSLLRRLPHKLGHRLLEQTTSMV